MPIYCHPYLRARGQNDGVGEGQAAAPQFLQRCALADIKDALQLSIIQRLRGISPAVRYLVRAGHHGRSRHPDDHFVGDQPAAVQHSAVILRLGQGAIAQLRHTARRLLQHAVRHHALSQYFDHRATAPADQRLQMGGPQV
jgi:hypothetical protein